MTQYKQKNRNNKADFSKRNASYVKSNETFVNPYNFIQTSFVTKSKGELNPEEKLTGYLVCDLKTITPLAIPDTEKKIEDNVVKGHYKYPVSKINDDVVIFGSSIRGAIRSVYETVTDSCYRTNKDEMITMRSNKAFSPCILERIEKNPNNESKEKWALYKATRYVFIIDDNFIEKNNKLDINNKINNNALKIASGTLSSLKSGTPVIFKNLDAEHIHKDKKTGVSTKLDKFVDKDGFKIIKEEEITKYKDDGKKIGYINIGEEILNKHFESIFDKGEKIAELTNEDVKQLRIIKEIYNDESINKLSKEHKYYKDFDNEYKNGRITAWFSVEDVDEPKTIENGKIKYKRQPKYKLSLASLGRTAYSNTMKKQLMSKFGCRNRKTLCKACALFGMSEDENVGSKVRFTDAKPKEGNTIKYYRNGEYITLKELAGPKISYMPFYLRQVGEYDVWSYDSSATEIRGRKIYWHHPFNGVVNQKTKRNTSMILIDQNNVFEFKVYFDGISIKQLEELKWSLTFGDNINDNLCHKIGHGKPLGLGSVRISITSQVLRNNSNDYSLEVTNNDKITINKIYCDENTLKDVLKVANFKSMDKYKNEIEYPGIVADNPDEIKKNKLAAHVWFTRNFKIGDKSPKAELSEVYYDDRNEGEYQRINKYKAIPK